MKFHECILEACEFYNKEEDKCVADEYEKMGAGCLDGDAYENIF